MSRLVRNIPRKNPIQVQISRSGILDSPAGQRWSINLGIPVLLVALERRKFGEAVALTRKSLLLRDEEVLVVDLNQIKVTQRDQEVLSLLVQGCSNKEIAEQLRISTRTVKQHLRTLFLRAGIKDGRKRVKLATAVYMKERTEYAAV